MPVELADKVIQLPLTSLIADYPDRSPEDLKKVEHLAKNMALVGQLDPIRVTKAENGKYFVISGKRRVAAAKKNELKTLDAIVVDTKDILKDIAIVSDNLFVRAVNPLNQAKIFRKLLDEKVFKNQLDLAEHIGISQSSISNALKFLEAPEDAQDAVASGQLAMSDVVGSISKRSGKKPKSAKEIKSHKKKARVVKLPASYLTPEGRKEPIDSIQVFIGKETVKVSFIFDPKGLKKNGVLKKCEAELSLIGDKELTTAIETVRDTSF